MSVASVCIETLRRHAGLVIVAMFTLGVAIFVSDKTKNSLDMDGVEMFAWYLGIAIWCLVCRAVTKPSSGAPPIVVSRAA